MMVFLDMETQWRIVQGFGYAGLDYTALDAVMRMRRIKGRTEMFNLIRMMEGIALEVMNKKQ